MNKNVENSNVPLLMKLLSVVLVGIIALVIWQVTRANQVEQTPPPTTNATTPATTADEKKATTTDVKTGIVKGTAIYPSEGYPEDFKVCVLNESTKAEIVCDSGMAGKSGVQMYEVNVTPGTYIVAAKTGTMTGYYDEYMKNESYKGSNTNVCDVKYHTPIVIEVAAGKTLENITAGNFYYVQENC